MQHTISFRPFFSLGFLVLGLLIGTQTLAQSSLQLRSDNILQQHIEEIVRGFHGDVGVYVRHLKTGQCASVNADSLFPTASMIKVPILCGIMERIRKGELTFDSVVTYRDSMKYDDGFTGSLKDSSKVPVGELVHLMLTLSDNTASVWLERLAGGGMTINRWLDANGFHATRVNSRTPEREQFRNVYGWGQTTPREMAELVVLIHQGKAVSPAASDRMDRALGRSYWDGESLSQIPSSIHVLSNQGAVNQSKSEVVLVNAPSGDDVFCVITKNQTDTRWVHENEGYLLLRRISHLLLNYFEPSLQWSPLQGIEKFSP